MSEGGAQEPLGVDDAALLGYGNDLVNAAADIPAAPAAFTVTGGDAISQKISSLLPALEQRFIDGLPDAKEEAKGTAERIVGAAQTYQRTDEQIAQLILGGELDESGAVPGAIGGTSAGVGAGTASAVGGGGAATGASSGSRSGASSAAMSQLMGMPMQIAGQAAQIPTQAMGALAAIPQAVTQVVQQVAQMAGGEGGPGESPEAPEEDQRDEATAEQPERERAPVESPVADADSTPGVGNL